MFPIFIKQTLFDEHESLLKYLVLYQLFVSLELQLVDLLVSYHLPMVQILLRVRLRVRPAPSSCSIRGCCRSISAGVLPSPSARC